MPNPAAASPDRESYPRWRALTWLALYRLFLAAGVNVVIVPPVGQLWLEPHASRQLTTLVSIIYLLLVLVGLLVTRMRWMGKAQLAQTGVFVDIIAFTLLMHGSGGVESGFGLLLAISVAAGALLLEGRLSLLFASFATLSVMAEQTYRQLSGEFMSGSFTRAGLLGLTYFTVAGLAHVLSRRIHETERLAESRQVDVADLSKLNEFIIQRMGTGVLVLDEQRRVRLMNSAASTLLGTPPNPNLRPLNQMAPELARWLSHGTRVGGKDPSSSTVSIRDREVDASYVLLGGRPSGAVLLFLRDKRALIQEAQQIKLASLGGLTASIAHNIRNPLSAINHAGQLLAESPALGHEDLRLIRIIERNTGRIDEIVESVLQLSRRHQAASESIELGPWLMDFCSEFRESRRLPPHRLELHVSPNPPPVEADPRHLRQILSNLCDNSISHAGAPERPAKVLLQTGQSAPDGPVFVKVCDDGPLIAPDIAREMFSPFFTTRVAGTGLGLYIALELSEANGIELEYIGAASERNCFRLTLPTL